MCGVATRNVALQREPQGIVRVQFVNGAATSLHLERAPANPTATQALLPGLAQSLARSKNRLTTLLGEVPGARNGQLDPPAPTLFVLRQLWTVNETAPLHRIDKPLSECVVIDSCVGRNLAVQHARVRPVRA